VRRIWGFSNWSLVELVEAGARSGKTEAAADALERLAQIAACCTDWALGTEARSRALVSEGEAAENIYQEAIRRLDRARVRVELARAHLLYGEWLRRERRRLDARKQLRHAHELFSQFGIEAFAERARGELEATGEHARKRTAQMRDDLTPQGSTDRPPRGRGCHQPRHRSPRSCSAAPARSTTTYARRFASSE
jgi:tetratricopeptide (TPR) repeat protein